MGILGIRWSVCNYLTLTIRNLHTRMNIGTRNERLYQNNHAQYERQKAHFEVKSIDLY